MKLCWDNLDKLIFMSKTLRWRGKTGGIYDLKESCAECGEPFLFDIYTPNAQFCTSRCTFKSSITRKKMSQNHADVSGKNNPSYGTKHSLKTRQKISENHADVSGDKNPRFGKGDNIRGEKNPNWRHGARSEIYCPTWTDKEFIEYITDRDKDKYCWNPKCLNKNGRRVRHHIDYIKKHCDPFNIITICNSCNSRANFNRNYWQNLFSEVMKERFNFKIAIGA